jgi:urea transport system permease protein
MASRTPGRALLALAALATTVPCADTDTLPAGALASPTDSVRTAAVKSLLGRPAFARFLQAMHDGEVKTGPSGRLYIAGDEDWSGDAPRVPLSDPLSGEPLPGPGGSALMGSSDTLTDLPVDRDLRTLLESSAATGGLSDPDPATRRKAVESFLPDGTGPVLPDLRKALAAETDKRIRPLLAFAVAVGELTDGPDSARIQAANRVGASGMAAGITILRARAAAQSPAVSAEFLKQATRLETGIRSLEKVQIVFSGISLGSILVLVALGLSITYGLAGVINMAHGEFLMVGAYTTYAVQSLVDRIRPGGDAFFWISLPAAICVAGAVGMLLEWSVLRHLKKRPLESLLATWGVSLILVQAARSLFGDLTAVRQPALFTGGFDLSPSVTLPWNRIFIVVVAAAALGAVAFVLQKTRFGLRLRAVVQNRDMSACLGVRTARVDRLAFFLGGGLAGLAGWAMTLVGNVVPNMGESYIVDSFLVVVTGGVGKLLGTVIAGLGIGMITKVLEPSLEAVYGKVVLLGLVILFLQVRPTGIFAPRGRGEDA